MNRWTGTFVAMLVCAFLAVVVFFVADMNSDKVFATPEECFEASRTAIEKDDLRSWCQCLTDDSRDVLALKDVLFFYKEVIEKADTDQKKTMIRGLVAVQNKHGLTEEFLAKLEPEAIAQSQENVPMEDRLRFAQKVLAPVGDRNAFFAEMNQVIIKGSGVHPFAELANAKLSKVKITGKTAQGTITVKQGGRDHSDELFFRKQGEGWRIDIIGAQKRPPTRGFQHP